MIYPGISKMPFIVTRATSGKIGKLIEQANTQNIKRKAFTDTMTVGSWKEQVSKTKATSSEEITFYGIILFGPKDIVTEMTKKFSLWK